jgi:ethanolamine utilization protein EutQ (cupin superfamily)
MLKFDFIDGRKVVGNKGDIILITKNYIIAKLLKGGKNLNNIWAKLRKL